MPAKNYILHKARANPDFMIVYKSYFVKRMIQS